MLLRILTLVMIVAFAGCKGDKSTTATKAGDTPVAAPLEFDDRLPNPCEVMATETIAGLVGTDAGALEVKDASNTQNLFSKACFFKWDDPNMTDAGVMVQIMTNPVEEEAPEYLQMFIASKKTAGESTIGSDKKILYRDFPGFGDDGAYSNELHKYLWRLGDDFSFLLAFNTTLNKDEELAAAKVLATEIMQKFR